MLDSQCANNVVDGLEHLHWYMGQRACALLLQAMRVKGLTPVYSGLLPSLQQTGQIVQTWALINPMTAKSHLDTVFCALICPHNCSNSNSSGASFSKIVL
jgi:hypothetical protein